MAQTVEEHAKAFLEEKKVPVDRIVRVDTDAILFVNEAGHARTCWLTYDEESGKLEHEVEHGFPLARSV